MRSFWRVLEEVSDDPDCDPDRILWSDIWDLVVMEIDELRSIIPPE
jgi:hypothetical protein